MIMREMTMNEKVMRNLLYIALMYVGFAASASACVSFESYVDKPSQETPVVQPACSEEVMVGLPLTIYDPEKEHPPYFKAYFLEIAQIRAYLNRHPAVGLVLIGHSDERAIYVDSEYRGLQYANKVKQILMTMGFPEYRLKTTSMGKEKPLDREHTPAAWAKNRRVEVVPVLIKNFPRDASD